MDPIDISASALTAHRRRLEVISHNLANAETTRTAAGGPYRRQAVVFGEKVDEAGGSGVEVVAVTTDPTPGKRVLEPGHPDADANGYVQYPNVNPMEEMVDVISTTRSYEANVTALNSTKSMVLKALDLARE